MNGGRTIEQELVSLEAEALKAGEFVAITNDLALRLVGAIRTRDAVAAAFGPNLIVEFIVPHYFASLFASQYPDEHGGFGAQVTFRNEEDEPETITGDVSVFENTSGDWLIEVRHEDGEVMLGTSIENVERIVVL